MSIFFRVMNLENEFTRRLDNSRLIFVLVFKRRDRKCIILFIFSSFIAEQYKYITQYFMTIKI